MSESKPGRRERYAALTRSAIVEAARMLFVDRGFDDTSVDDIADAAQVSKGAIYHHFKDKQEIFIDVYRDATKGVIENVVKVLIDVPAGSWDRIEAAASAVIKGYTDNREPRVLVRQVMGVLGAERTQALEGELALPLIRTLLTEAEENGELRDLSIEKASQLIFRVLCESSLLIANSADYTEAAQEVETVMLYMFAGLRKPPATARARRKS
ncbi:TetR/AcrR family transcriptional regulator [Mycobacteroides immunogenum]|uniref:TetR family transcriptional regulator n=1 Tax=Mycobacteroides immunogenum TaxID=83262 RepID=A0A7V8RUL6_9MYCO|nr:TetR/AcrR family transcriptional regulator [Mycobacteroides immunogenum]AMT70937.1 TetR family transcriptional regulator [Mycobacteroides immunogenum]ANO04045.1 TetR family transcriptional regulator [Mycobacteroides immunogenum]KIU39523.1 TetR family transcriptional regulator [Mycobacteroides immunogenum]KPG03941.1 TetR family transcriptional regulator [Mycobacteroides immunogenum]KPG04480.1 TetR family transcriptional regulator [Mycobacteroides immunogenum]